MKSFHLPWLERNFSQGFHHSILFGLLAGRVEHLQQLIGELRKNPNSAQFETTTSWYETCVLPLRWNSWNSWTSEYGLFLALFQWLNPTVSRRKELIFGFIHYYLSPIIIFPLFLIFYKYHHMEQDASKPLAKWLIGQGFLKKLPSKLRHNWN